MAIVKRAAKDFVTTKELLRVTLLNE